jgi:hypothetical protein
MTPADSLRLDSSRTIDVSSRLTGGEMQIQAKPAIARMLLNVAVLLVAAAANAQTTDPIIGTWNLDVAKSSFKPGPAPKSATVLVEPAGKGIKVSVDAVNADGSPMKWGFTTQRDGKDVPVTGNPAYDTAASTQRARPPGRPSTRKAARSS